LFCGSIFVLTANSWISISHSFHERDGWLGRRMEEEGRVRRKKERQSGRLQGHQIFG
jgi:hypothetical protein